MKKEANFELIPLFSNRNSKNVDGIVYTVATNKQIYKMNEKIDIKYSIQNTTNRKVVYEGFSKNCEYEMTITTINGYPIYTYSDHTNCMRMLSSITVDAHQTVDQIFPSYYFPSSRWKPQKP